MEQMEVLVLGRDAVSQIAECEDIVYRITDCCGASGKGSERGVVCRACYAQVDDEMGWAMVTRKSIIAEKMYGADKPSPEEEGWGFV